MVGVVTYLLEIVLIHLQVKIGMSMNLWFKIRTKKKTTCFLRLNKLTLTAEERYYYKDHQLKTKERIAAIC